MEALAFLVNSFPRSRWLEIAQRLRSFYKPNVTSPVVIEKYMRLNHEAMRAFMYVLLLLLRPLSSHYTRPRALFPG